MKAYSSEPVIFRCFGHRENTTTYFLPDFLYTYIIAGSGTVCIENELHSFTAGNSFVIARHREAQITMIPEESEEGYFHSISIRISEGQVEDYFLHNIAPAKPSKPIEGMLQLFPDHPLLHGLSLLLEDGIRQGFRAAWSFTKMKIQECIHILVALDERMYYWFSMHNRLQKIELKTFMEKNFRYNLPLEQMAEAAGRSLSTFRRDFIQEFGTTPSRWLIARRLEEARKLILSGKRPGEILVELGFESFSHFTRCYKQKFGILPSEERENSLVSSCSKFTNCNANINNNNKTP